jgi:predicted alpha-1,6-mannanase (GH76 family)
MTPAGKLQAHLKRVVQQSGGQYRKVRWEGRRGCPDCFVWWTWPRAAFIEVKAEGDRYSKLQEREVARMQDAGITVYTVSTIEGIDFVVSEIR